MHIYEHWQVWVIMFALACILVVIVGFILLIVWLTR